AYGDDLRGLAWGEELRTCERHAMAVFLPAVKGASDALADLIALEDAVEDPAAFSIPDPAHGRILAHEKAVTDSASGPKPPIPVSADTIALQSENRAHADPANRPKSRRRSAPAFTLVRARRGASRFRPAPGFVGAVGKALRAPLGRRTRGRGRAHLTNLARLPL